MSHTLINNIQTAAKEHPWISSGLWFSLATALPMMPILLILFILGISLLQPIWGLIQLLISIVIIPVILAALIGMVPGYKILSLPSKGTPRAALYGLATGLAVFFLWVFALEITPNLPTFTANNNPSGDIPGAAIVVAYLVVLPGLVIGVMAYGAVAGILLHIISIYPVTGAD